MSKFIGPPVESLQGGWSLTGRPGRGGRRSAQLLQLLLHLRREHVVRRQLQEARERGDRGLRVAGGRRRLPELDLANRVRGLERRKLLVDRDGLLRDVRQLRVGVAD